MIDIKWIRQNPDLLDRSLVSRGASPIADKIVALDDTRRQAIGELETLRRQRNNYAQEMSLIKDKSGAEFQNLRSQASELGKKIAAAEESFGADRQLEDLLNNLPNILDSSIPEGKDESFNKTISTFGEIDTTKIYQHHQDIAHNLGMFDTKQTVRISGSRFATLTRSCALLERALANFMLDYHISRGFVEVSPPYLVKEEAMYNVGLLPKFAHDSFSVSSDFRLIPTAEVSLVNMVADMILPRQALPIRMVAHTPCFRSEAGSAGRDTKGLIRMHQFSKVELVSITAASESEQEHELIRESAEGILKQLGLPYRVVLLCSGDTGFQSCKTYDLEVWMPSQMQYREISSCSNCTDFQSRRMKTRYKEFGEQENTFVHTLNGSGLAIGRTLAAILENYQNDDGSVTVPECLINYMQGMTKITPINLDNSII